jgi:hypothetical protein
METAYPGKERAIMKEKIKRGADLLDEVRPSWDGMQDLNRLDIGSSVDCVVGQSFPEMPYFLALQKLFPNQDEVQAARDHGFGVEWHGMNHEQRDQAYDQYTQEWKSLIQARRKVNNPCLQTI